MKIKKMKKNEKKFSGLTLIEMLMAIAIFTIGIAGLTLLFSRTWQINSYVLEMGQSSLSTSQGVSKMVDYIRRARQADNGSYPIKSADDNELVIYSDYNKDGVTERLHFYKSGQNILMGVTNPTVTLPKNYPEGDQQTITLASNIVNGLDLPIFYYYNRDYPGDEVNNPIPTPLSGRLADARLVKIYIEMNINSNRASDNIKMQSFVEMRNLNDYDRVQ